MPNCKGCSGEATLVKDRLICHECLLKERRGYYQKNKEGYQKKAIAYYQKNQEQQKRATREYYKNNTAKVKANSRVYNTTHPWVQAKARAKKRGLYFSLEENDPIWGLSHCEFCGVEFSTTNRNSTKSVDRLDNSAGYVTGNVAALCFECNRRKSDHTPQQLRAMADWIESKLGVE